MSEPKKILVGLSGGVDSSVAISLLREKYEVAGATMTFHVNDETDAAQAENVRYAREICESLGVPHYVFDVTAEFKKNVIDYFVHSYEVAETPNPCFICNQKIKFGVFWEKARALGFDHIATGHYAKVQYDQTAGRYKLLADEKNPKDQSYFLASLNQEQLSQVIFPLADLTKPEVKKIAGARGLKTVFRKESQDICFVQDGDYAKIIEAFSHAKMNEGNFLAATGEVVGTHQGLFRYTIGQRRGLHLSLGVPMYVLEKRLASNEIVVAPRDALSCKGLFARELNFLSPDLLAKLKTDDVELAAKTRYRTKAKKCVAQKLDKAFFENAANGTKNARLKKAALLRLDFMEPDFAVAPGQALVLYCGNEVAASGIIDSSL